ncbi:MAG: alpha/beta fold hydrolase [Paenirhodobacter sp.]|uniref:alpha/beta fold hydrolase n=1 Tax=Paenirhodobacter sp. TaxID=1965326 RepID=UPI003D12539D
MLYEIALPALLLRGAVQRLRPATVMRPAPVPGMRLRAQKCRLRRQELDWLCRVSPRLGARLVLARIERVPRDLRCRKAPAIRVFGEAGQPKLLLLHGWNATGAMMHPLAQRLARLGFSVTVPELTAPGLAPHGRFEPLHVARMLARQFGAAGPYAAVIGHSAGGLVGALAASEGLGAARIVTISSSASLGSLYAGYLKFTDAPAALQSAVPACYRARYGRDPAQVGPAEYRRFGAAQLVLHARNDWQVAPAAAYRICAERPDLQPRFLDACNHRTVLEHPDLADIVARFALCGPEVAAC